MLRETFDNATIIARRELRAYFSTPIAPVFLTVFVALTGAFTFYIGGFFERGQADLTSFFAFHPWLYLLLVPAVAMRLWAEERKSGTIELLMTLPVTASEAMLGKFVAAWAFIGLALLLTLPMWITVNVLGRPDNGIILASYLGSFLMAGGFLAIGSFVSALTKNQVIAFIIAALISFLFTMSEAPANTAAHVASGKINVIVVADTDMLADQFWIDRRDMMGQDVVMPAAHNAAFVIGALDNLSGNNALIALRGRGVRERPFTYVEALRRDAERRFRDKEQALEQKLKTAQEELGKLQASGEGVSVILSQKEREAVEKFRSEMLDTRRQLREVKLALRRDIDTLDGWLKFTNIALVPLLLGVAGAGWGLQRARQRNKPEMAKTSNEGDVA